MFVYNITISSYQVFLPCFPALLDPAELYWAMLKEQNKKFSCETFGQNLTLKCDWYQVIILIVTLSVDTLLVWEKKCLGDKQIKTLQ